MSDTATPSAPAPAAPSNVSTSPAAGLSLSAVMSKVAGNTSVQDAPQPEQPVIKIVKEAPPEVAAPVTAPVETPAEIAAAAPEVTPASETPVEAAPAEPEATGELSLDDGDLTLRAQRNGDGTFKNKLDPNEKLDLEMVVNKQTGERRKYSKTLPEIVRLAKDGIAMQQARGELENYRANVPQLQQHAETLEQQLQAQIALNTELLSADDAIVAARRQQYAQEMSPEKRLARMERERAEERTTREQTERQTRHQQVANSFIGSRIAPELAKAEAVLGVETVTGKVMLLTQDLIGPNGVIPPAHWPEMERRISAVDGPFQAWLTAETAKRSQSNSEIERQKAALKERQQRAQQVVNDTGRTIAPIGRAAADTPPAQPKPTNTREAISRMINRPLPTTVQHAVGTG